MTREELIEKMLDAYQRLHYSHNRPTDGYNSLAMAAALDIAVGELLGEPSQDEADASGLLRLLHPPIQCLRDVFRVRRSRYLPKSDPAVEKAREICVKYCIGSRGPDGATWYNPFLEEIVAAVRAADKGSHALR